MRAAAAAASGGGGGGGGEGAAAYFCAGEALVGGAVGGGSEVLLWDASGALAQRLAGHAAPLRALACSRRARPPLVLRRRPGARVGR